MNAERSIFLLPSFEDGFNACKAQKCNFVCITGGHRKETDMVINTITEAFQDRALILDQYDEILLCPRNIELYTQYEFIVLKNLDGMDIMEQNRIAKWLQRLEHDLPKILCVGLVSDTHSMTSYLKDRFWFGTQAPVGSIPDSHVSHATCSEVVIHSKIKRYISDIIIHIRMHRLASCSQFGGSGSRALKKILMLAQWMVVVEALPGRTFATPDIIQQACMWYFPFHIDLIKNPNDEGSIMYGTKPELVAELFKCLKLGAQKVPIENPLILESMIVRDVLNNVIPAI